MSWKVVGRSVLVVCLVLVSVGGRRVWATVAGAGRTVGGRGTEAVQVDPGWEQVNVNGFGNAQAAEVSAVAAFGNYLYAGTHNGTEGAQIWRSADGATWNAVTEPGFGNAHDTAPPAILDLTEFNGYLYASTGRGDGPGQIWRTVNGLNWAPMVIAGFADPDTVNITALAEYNGVLYAGATNLVKGAQIWRSFTGDSNSWTQATAPVATDGRISGFAVSGGALYAAVTSQGPVQVWRSVGGEWTTVVGNGFGRALTSVSGGLAAFGGSLYIGAGNTGSGPELWRSADGATWEEVLKGRVGGVGSTAVEAVFANGSELYVSVTNNSSGMEVWRSADGDQWEQSSVGGFGDSGNVHTNGSNATGAFDGALYVGTANAADGGELWRLPATVVPAYGVVLSAGGAAAGQPGQTISHTITIQNSGNVADSFGLTLGGQSWPTVLSGESIAVAAGASSTFAVAVTIPVAVAAGASDTVMVTATSQADGTVSDMVAVTTRYQRWAHTVYVPIVFKG